MTFLRELEGLLNKYNKEQGSNTPDFLLANYLSACLDTYDATIQARARWYGRMDVTGQVILPPYQEMPEAHDAVTQSGTLILDLEHAE